MTFKEPDPAAIDELAQTCGIKPDYDLHVAIHSAARLYDILSSQPKRKQQKEWLDQIIRSADALVKKIDAFDGVLSTLTPYTQAQLSKQIVLHRYYGPEIEHQRMCVRQHAETTASKAKWANKRIKDVDAYGSVIKLLMDVYMVAVEKPSLVLQNKKSKSYGELFDFIATCFRIIGVNRERMTLHNDLTKLRKEYIPSKSKKAIMSAKDRLNDYDPMSVLFLYGPEK